MKEPVLLTTLIETSQLRWLVAGISLDGDPIPLMRSVPSNLATYLDLPEDEQVSFLRHRLSGVLQRGCDRLWGLVKKPCHIVFVAESPFPNAAPQLTERVAEHFVTWMTSPAVSFFVSENGFPEGESPRLKLVAGDLPEQYRSPLADGLLELIAIRNAPDRWEEAPARMGG